MREVVAPDHEHPPEATGRWRRRTQHRGEYTQRQYAQASAPRRRARSPAVRRGVRNLPISLSEACRIEVPVFVEVVEAAQSGRPHDDRR